MKEHIYNVVLHKKEKIESESDQPSRSELLNLAQLTFWARLMFVVMCCLVHCRMSG